MKPLAQTRRAMAAAETPAFVPTFVYAIPVNRSPLIVGPAVFLENNVLNVTIRRDLR